MEKLPFSKQELIGIIKRYYLDFEEKDVRVNIWCGKTIYPSKNMPVMGTVNFDVFEVAYVGEKVAKFPIPVDDDDLKRIVSAVLEKAGFKVEDLSYTVLSEDPRVFTGIAVTGEKVKKEEKTI